MSPDSRPFLPTALLHFWTLSGLLPAFGMTSFRPYQLSSVNHFPAGNRSRPPLSLTWCRQSIRSFHPPSPTPEAVFCSPLVAYHSTWTHPGGLVFPARLHAILLPAFGFLAGCRCCSIRLSAASRFAVPVAPRIVHAIVPLSFRCFLLRRLALWHSRLSFACPPSRFIQLQIEIKTPRCRGKTRKTKK